MTFNLEQILRLSRSRKLLVLFGVLGLILALYIWLFFLPLQNEIRAKNRRLSSLLSQKAEQEAIVENLEVFKTEYLHLQESLNKAMAQLPNQKEIPSLLENISNLGRECGLELPLFKPDKEVPKDFYAEVPVDMKISGSFLNIATFFYKIGRLPRIVTISNIEISAPKQQNAPKQQKDQDNDSLLDASCRATTYRFLEPNERPEATQHDKKPVGKGEPESTPGKSPPSGKGA